MNYNTVVKYLNKVVGIELNSGARIKGTITKLEDEICTFTSSKGTSEIEISYIAVILLLEE